MAKRYRLDWNLSAFEEIRRLPEVESELDSAAEAVADEANRMSRNAGYLAVSGDGLTRSRAAVVAPTPRSAYDNAVHHTMVKAMVAALGRDS